jgi:hypothetical protein
MTMLRKARPISLFRALLLGAVLATAPLAGGCTDPNDPMTFVEEMKDPAKQPQAVKRLKQFYEDAMTKDKKDRGGAHVKPLLDKIAEPLTKACVEVDLQPRVRTELIALISDFRDARTEACLKKALEDYKPDTGEDDVRNVMRAVTAMKQKSLAPQVMKVFTTIKFSNPKVKLIGKDVTAAVLAVADKAQEDEFIAMLDKPIDPSNEANVHDEAFWQTVAVRALGDMKSEKAVRPLIKLVLTPKKAPVRNTALVALVKIGKAAVKPTEAVLKGEDKEIVEYAQKEQLAVAEKDKDGKIPAAAQKQAEKAHISTAAEILGALGAESSVAPLLSARGSADDAGKVVLAMVLPLLPKSNDTLEAYKTTFDEAKMDLDVPGVGGAKELLADGSGDFFDASLVPWLVDSSTKLKGEQADVDAIRGYALQAAIKLMKADQVPEVEKLYNLDAQGTDAAGKQTKTVVGKAFESEFKQAKELVGNCKEDLACYHAKLTNEKTQGKDQQFAGIKAAYMIGILGGEADRKKLVDDMPKITNGSVRMAALKALQALSPKGDNDAADKLTAYLDKAEEAKDDNLVQSYQVFTQVAARLRARAQ